ncbi:MAG TPA: CHAT domain-containing protein [Candidatus Acidoferrales bacterium]|nr:CHAT domain-containing protein [Candidatus Acidoferrales bacterium]
MSAQRPSCPEDDVLQELAAGILAPAMAEQAMLHVAECKSCGPTLRQYLKEFSEEQSPENIAILKQLHSSKPVLQKNLVRQLIGGGRRFFWLKPVPATAALVVVIFGLVLGSALWPGFQLHKAQKEVAAAFVERRTTTMRLTSVDYSPYSPFPIVLGAEDGRGVDEVPTSLHEASGAANKVLRAAKADPHWLQIQGRALLWESTPSSLAKAEKDFQKARSEGLATPSLEIDLAVSYFERDSRAEHPNLQRTLNLLNEVLSKPNLSKDDQASALFNLAIAYEKTQAWDLAVETWRKYLQVDSTSGWAREARQRLENAIPKASVKRQQSYSDPSFFLQQKAQGALRPEDPEQYQQKALSQWLPAAVTDKNSDAYRALEGLAEVFAEHQDFWWRDFLKIIQPKDQDAVQELATATLDNEQGTHNDALTYSRAAIKSFKSAGNVPGELFARFQEVYALRSKMDGDDCVARADPLMARLAKSRFNWLHGQSLLERAQCRNFQAQLAKSDADAAQSLILSKQFPVLTMRILGIVPGMKRQQGKYEESWTRAVEGLKVYWQGTYPAERLDQFYAVMFQDAEDSHSPYLAESLLRHNIALRIDPKSEISKNLLREGMLHLELANLLNARQAGDEGKKEMQTALSILQTVARSYPDNYIVSGGVRTAEAELQRQKAEQALGSLAAMAVFVHRTQNKELALNYYRLMGGVYLNLGKLNEAGASFESAIEIADAALEGLTKDADRGAWKQATEESYRGAVRVLLAQKKDWAALERWERYKARISQQRELPGEIQAANAISATRKSALPFPSSPALRLIYANFADGVQIWSIRNGNIQSNWVKIAKNDLEKELRLFTEECATPDSSLIDVEREGLKLYALLVQPAAAELAEAKTVIAELDQSAYDLPLEGLKTPAGSYFGEKYSVVYSPGLWTEQLLRSPGAIGQAQSLFLLDATHSGYLPGMEVERDFIAKSFPKSRVVDAENVNWGNLRPEVAASQIFHYMGHGRPSSTGTDLVLNPKESLGAADFTPDRFAHSEMVVLAACSSGRSGKEGLLDTQNLVHSFLVAGVPQVIASHWDVDSGSTSQLMVSFYRHVLTEPTVAEAMLDARRDVLEKTPHPYYWAGFSVTGRLN